MLTFVYRSNKSWTQTNCYHDNDLKSSLQSFCLNWLESNVLRSYLEVKFELEGTASSVFKFNSETKTSMFIESSQAVWDPEFLWGLIF